MITKIYKYKIKKGTEKLYLEIQESVQKLYRELAEVEFSYLKNPNDNAFRTEVIRFFDSNIDEVLKKIDSDPRILKLFDQFTKEVLDDTIPIHEEVLIEEPLSNSGKIHHVEIYCSDLIKSSSFWSWFLIELGYKQYQKWQSGISFKLGASYIVFVQAEDKYLNEGYHRCRPGLNHLAFHASSPQQVDDLTRQLKDHGMKILYGDKHPYAGGPGSYGVFFEDPERIKVEVMAP